MLLNCMLYRVVFSGHKMLLKEVGQRKDLTSFTIWMNFNCNIKPSSVHTLHTMLHICNYGTYDDFTVFFLAISGFPPPLYSRLWELY